MVNIHRWLFTPVHVQVHFAIVFNNVPQLIPREFPATDAYSVTIRIERFQYGQWPTVLTRIGFSLAVEVINWICYHWPLGLVDLLVQQRDLCHTGLAPAKPPGED